jgi:hypothetical protein
VRRAALSNGGLVIVALGTLFVGEAIALRLVLVSLAMLGGIALVIRGRNGLPVPRVRHRTGRAISARC